MLFQAVRYILIIILFSMMATKPFYLYAQTLSDAADLSKELVIDECVEIALKNHPTLKAAEASVEASRSQVWEGRSAYFPQVNITTGYSENYSTSTTLKRIQKLRPMPLH